MGHRASFVTSSPFLPRLRAVYTFTCNRIAILVAYFGAILVASFGTAAEVRAHEFGRIFWDTRYVSSGVSHGDGPSRLGGGPKLAASFSSGPLRRDVKNCPMAVCTCHPNGRLYRFDPPRTSSACKVVSLGNARDGCSSDPKKIIMKLHASWGHASPQQLKRV